MFFAVTKKQRRCLTLVPYTNFPMGSKKAFALRIDSDKLAAIEKWAADDFRSTNGQLEWIIDQALRKAGRLKKGKTKDDDSGNT